MRFEDAFTARAAAFRLTQDPSRSNDFLGTQFFPAAKKMGVDLKWIKAHKGLSVALKPSTFDALATIRPRKGFEMQATEMPLFRESMIVKEMDQYHILRAMDSNDPYVADVVNHIFDDVAELRDGAEVAAERMRMALLAPANGQMQLSIGLADQTVYNYDYDPNGDWATDNYDAKSGDDEWSAPLTATPLSDIEAAKTALAAKGYTGRYILMNTATFNMMAACQEVKDVFIASNLANVVYISKAAVRGAIEANTGLTILIYDKQYVDYDGTTKKFYPDGYVSVIAGELMGNTWYGTTPEELNLLNDSEVDVAVYEDRIAIAEKVEYGPPVRRETTVSQICLPSFEGMDGLYVMKVD